VIVWPNLEEVEGTLQTWALSEAQNRPELLGLGYFGSYARGNWGVGSDLDVVVIVTRCEHSKERRNLDWDTVSLPVPVDLFIYTRSEWENLQKKKSRFSKMLAKEINWVYRRAGISL
jgi:predicted nucleotidyltransferase